MNDDISHGFAAVAGLLGPLLIFTVPGLCILLVGLFGLAMLEAARTALLNSEVHRD